MSGIAELRVYLLNWNGGDATVACLDAVERSVGIRPDVYVVDNASTDGSRERLRARLGDDRVISLSENRGYAGGMNAALDHLGQDAGELALLLTQDVVVEPEALARLAAAMRVDPAAGVAGPVVVYRDAPRIISAGGAIEPRRVRAPLHREVLRPEPYGVTWVDGCCMLVRREAAEAVGGFDEAYFLYFEETDFCWRLRRHGWSVVVVPDATVWHDKREIPPPRYYHYTVRNRYRFWHKNFTIGTARVALAVARETAGTLAWWGAAVLAGAPREERATRRTRFGRQLRGAFAGTWAYLRGETGRMPEPGVPRESGTGAVPAGDDIAYRVSGREVISGRRDS